MCGILGVLPARDKKQFSSALDKIEHRGPDGFGIWNDDQEKVMLGHRRLSILDLSDDGSQPMHYLHYTITFNGEIYNFVELKDELVKFGYQFRTQSDTEVIVAAYDKWKAGCLSKMNGMWSFAIWDSKRQELFISRDRFGKKPLFYSLAGNQFIFGSEMKAIAPLLSVVRISDHFSICAERMFDYEQTEDCLLHGIKRFPSACYAVYKAGDTAILPITYWDTLETLVDVPNRYEDQVQVFRDLFIDACKIRMRSDVPIGTALSGGLDSSATICTMAHIANGLPSDRVSKDWQHAFVACFKGSFIDERPFAETVVDHLGINATYLEIDPVAGIGDLMESLYKFEELYITSPVPMMQTYGAVKQNGVTVTIDGHGADEMMSGYGTTVYDAFLDCGINALEIRDILSTYNGTRRVDSVQVGHTDAGWKDYYGYMNRTLKGRKNLVKYWAKSVAQPLLSKRRTAGLGNFNSTLYQMFHNTILPTLLRNYDRYAMANGVEIRMPFMDHRLVSFAFSLPWQSKIGKGYTKRIIRDAVRPFMPQTIVNRKTKIGFNTPIVDWMKGPWKPYFLDHLHSTSFKQSNLVNAKEVEQKVMQVINDPAATFSHGEQAWIAMTPYFWEQGFYKQVAHG